MAIVKIKMDLAIFLFVELDFAGGYQKIVHEINCGVFL